MLKMTSLLPSKWLSCYVYANTDKISYMFVCQIRDMWIVEEDIDADEWVSVWVSDLLSNWLTVCLCAHSIRWYLLHIGVHCSMWESIYVFPTMRQQTIRAWIKQLNAFYIMKILAAAVVVTAESTNVEFENEIERRATTSDSCTPMNINWTESFKIE